MLQEFKKFLLRGNVIDLAIAVVIGTAFKAVVGALVANIVMPIVGIIGGKPTFDDYTITINDSVIRWGSFVTAVVSFVIIAFALFVMIKSFERLQDLRKGAADTAETNEPLTVGEELLAEIRDLLKAGGTGTPAPPA
ncbi:large conductance mechanosensitive channel protein MscL [Aquihabitans sp. G128]|uniref:large conductance mechanosensitive channel protein MscL n=1 Tax=Aquihabitans sp. G128 TaxID=2849779 RepID=UPI001C232A8B|nr:large conductance mechanosensitive channel protein MscL [Aquihabitans sp. G128]QXC61323.1 large conductance mechanosensitive channel protein MscL [Aquihabitans sp. G128]